ncbi:MAG: transporter substrate-binding domain-containing protein, partial [Anaerolineae bacterium]|nr:transporter substrate-binding domain-containing protein [Anaerolineae bacterium]
MSSDNPLRFWSLPFLTLLLAITILNGCTQEENKTPPPYPTPSPTPSPTATPLPDGATTGARILSRGLLRVGVRYDLEPFGYITEEGEVAGFGVDLGRELARRWLGNPDAVQFRQVRTDTAVQHLQNGDVDIVITAIIHTQDREDGADFSLPYFMDGHALLVRAADAPLIRDITGLQGRKVGVVIWESARDALEAMLPFTVTFQTYDRFDTAVMALKQGDVDAVAELRSRLFWGMRLFPESLIIGQYTAAPVALAFPENDPFFADLVNLTLQELVADGTYATLYARWFAPDYPLPVERWEGTEVPSLATTPILTHVPDTISAIKTRGKLIIAMPPDRSPFAYIDTNGTPAGYEVNLVQRMARRWLGDSSAIEFITTTLDSGKEMVRTGQADVLIGGLPHTRAAELQIDFSLTTYWAGDSIMAWAGTPITGLQSLQGQTVAVVENSMEAVQQAAQEMGIPLTIIPQPSASSALPLLEGEYATAVIGDRADLLGPAYATPGVGVFPWRINHKPLALGLPPGDSAFRDLVNLTLLAMKAEGELDAL